MTPELHTWGCLLVSMCMETHTHTFTTEKGTLEHPLKTYVQPSGRSLPFSHSPSAYPPHATFRSVHCLMLGPNSHVNKVEAEHSFDAGFFKPFCFTELTDNLRQCSHLWNRKHRVHACCDCSADWMICKRVQHLPENSSTAPAAIVLRERLASVLFRDLQSFIKFGCSVDYCSVGMGCLSLRKIIDKIHCVQEHSHCCSVPCACQGAYLTWTVWWQAVIPSPAVWNRTSVITGVIKQLFYSFYSSLLCSMHLKNNS